MKLLKIESKTTKRYCVLLFIAVSVFFFSIGQLLSGVANAGEEYIVNVSVDTYIYSDNPNDSFEGLSIVYGGGMPTLSWRGMFYYDLSSLPTGIQISSASWRIFAIGYDAPPQDFALYEISEDWWNEDSATWTWNNYLNSYEGNPQLIHDGIENTAGQWYEFPFNDLTVLQKWADNPSTNHGFMWKMVNEFTEESIFRIIVSTYEVPYFGSSLLIRDYYLDIQPTSLGAIKALYQ